MSRKNNDFYCGFAVVISSIIHNYDQPGMAAQIMQYNGVSIQDFKDAEIDLFDLKVIKKGLKNENMAR